MVYKIDNTMQLDMFKKHMLKRKESICEYTDDTLLHELGFTKEKMNSGCRYTMILRPSLCTNICLIQPTNETIHIRSSEDKRVFETMLLSGQAIKAQKIELEILCSYNYAAINIKGIIQKDIDVFTLSSMDHILFKYKKNMIELVKSDMISTTRYIDYKEYGSN